MHLLTYLLTNLLTYEFAFWVKQILVHPAPLYTSQSIRFHARVVKPAGYMCENTVLYLFTWYKLWVGTDLGLLAVTLSAWQWGCHYFLPGPPLPPQPKSINASWPVPKYTVGARGTKVVLFNAAEFLQILSGRPYPFLWLLISHFSGSETDILKATETASWDCAVLLPDFQDCLSAIAVLLSAWFFLQRSSPSAPSLGFTHIVSDTNFAYLRTNLHQDHQRTNFTKT